MQIKLTCEEAVQSLEVLDKIFDIDTSKVRQVFETVDVTGCIKIQTRDAAPSVDIALEIE